MRLSILIGLCVGVYLMVETATGRHTDLGRIRLSWERLLAILALQTLLLAWSAFCWRRVLREMFRKRIRWSCALHHIGIAGIAKYIPGKVWPFIARAMVAERSGVSKPNMLSASIFEQLLTLAVGGSIGLALIVPIESHLTRAVIAVALLAVLPVLIRLLLGQLESIRVMLPFVRERVPADALPTCPRYRSLAALVLCYLMLWLLTGAIASLVLPIIGVTLTPALATQVTGAVMLSVCGGFLALFAPGGLGVREGLMVASMSSSLGAAASIKFAILLRLWNVLYDIFSAACAAVAYVFEAKDKPVESP